MGEEKDPTEVVMAPTLPAIALTFHRSHISTLSAKFIAMMHETTQQDTYREDAGKKNQEERLLRMFLFYFIIPDVFS